MLNKQIKIITLILLFVMEITASSEVVCPYRYFYSAKHNLCLSINPNCDKYDVKNGHCLTCVDKYLFLDRGECKVYWAVGLCQERQSPQHDPCENIPNCKMYFKDRKTCLKCQEDYIRLNNDTCAKKQECGSNEELHDGSTCRQRPANCKKVDKKTWLCTQCNSLDYHIIKGVCLQKVICAIGQYMNDQGKCMNANPGCDRINTNNGKCITCKQANTAPRRGYCCPSGQVYNGKSCVSTSQLDLQNGGCETRHPSLGHCLKCILNHKIDPKLNQRCMMN